MGKKKGLRSQIWILGYDNARLDRLMARLGRSLEEAKKELGVSDGDRKKRSGRK